MSHQDRREPLPKGYQYPTHGVDCDCPPCRAKTTGVSIIRQYNIDCDQIVFRAKYLVSTTFPDGTVLTEWRDDPNVPVVTSTGYGFGV